MHLIADLLFARNSFFFVLLLERCCLWLNMCVRLFVDIVLAQFNAMYLMFDAYSSILLIVFTKWAKNYFVGSYLLFCHGMKSGCLLLVNRKQTGRQGEKTVDLLTVARFRYFFSLSLSNALSFRFCFFFLFVQFDLISFTFTILNRFVIRSIFMLSSIKMFMFFRNFIYIVTSVLVVKKASHMCFIHFMPATNLWFSLLVIVSYAHTNSPKRKPYNIYLAKPNKNKRKSETFSLSFTKKTICFLSFSYELRQDCYN